MYSIMYITIYINVHKLQSPVSQTSVKEIRSAAKPQPNHHVTDQKKPFAEATGNLKDLYAHVTGADNNVDNSMTMHALRPHTMEAHMASYKDLLHHRDNTISKWFLEVSGVRVSALNDCSYGVEHHFAGLKRLLRDDPRAGPANHIPDVFRKPSRTRKKTMNTKNTSSRPSLIRATVQLEQAAFAAVSLWAYAQTGWGWGIFALLILLPDMMMLGYLVNTRIGALCYNLGHSYLGPVALATFALLTSAGWGWPLALIWATHIAGSRHRLWAEISRSFQSNPLATPVNPRRRQTGGFPSFGGGAKAGG